MMMAKPKPKGAAVAPAAEPNEKAAPAPAEAPPSSSAAAAVVTPPQESMEQNLSPEEKVQELERRLAMLGGGGGGTTTEAPTTEAPTAASNDVEATTQKDEAPPPPQHPAPEPLSTTATAPAAAAPAKAAPETAGPANKNALLARIMAAQERAKAAEEKQKQQPPPTEPSVAAAAPPTFAATAPTVDEREKYEPPPPPPPFEAVEDVVMQVVSSSDQAVQQQQRHHEPSAPSAPPLDDEHHAAAGGGEGFERIVPLPAEGMTGTTTVEPPPPTFEQFEQQQQIAPAPDATAGAAEGHEQDAFDFNLDGTEMSPEAKSAMYEEQRRILDQIQKEKAENDAAIAAAAAAEFDSRSGPSVAAAAAGGGGATTTTTATDSASAESAVEASQRTVKIGSNQHVALHGQERTRKAIEAGTAILVQCMNCQNWMQVTDTATLMFCPVCQVISPVVKQTDVMTKEEAIQLTMDRRMAEQLQNTLNTEGVEEQEEGKDDDGVPGFIAAIDRRLFGDAKKKPPQQAHGVGGAAAQKTWWDTFSSMLSYGVTDEGENARRRGEIAVARPPGSTTDSSSQSGSPGTRALQSVSTVDHSTDEREGLLSSSVEGNAENLPAGRIAERQPLFSCVVDSVSNAASSLGSALTTHTLEEDNEGNIHGVDASSLLAVTSAGREGNSGGSYHAIPDEES